MLTISDAAADLIIREENSSEAYYNKLCRGFEWPGGASGPTVGIGYDCGYVTRPECVDDWTPYVSSETVEALLAGVGLQGTRAQAWVRQHRRDVDITWDQALAQFRGSTLPKWIERTSRALPNCEMLNPTCFGVLVSLTYNRGPSYRREGARYTEMRNILAHMKAQKFGLIPNEIKMMSRIWPKTSGVHKRRFNEAKLFSLGLSENVMA